MNLKEKRTLSPDEVISDGFALKNWKIKCEDDWGFIYRKNRKGESIVYFDEICIYPKGDGKLHYEFKNEGNITAVVIENKEAKK